MSVAAFSNYGDGSAGKPYLITTCAGLQEMGTNLSAHYKIMRGIDCTGFSFTTIAGIFTGELDGNYYEVKNLSVQNGLFVRINGATIKNIKLSGSVNSPSGSPFFAGSVAAIAQNSTIYQVYSTMSITGTASAGGGLMGQATDTTIDRSAYIGNMTGSLSDAGGLVGYSTNNLTIRDSYAQGSVRVVYAGGGLLGAVGFGMLTVERSYSAMSFTAAGAQFIGGITINGPAIVKDSFAVESTGLSAASIVRGGIFADPSIGANDNNYFDADAAGTTSCGGASGTCTALHLGSTPNYYKGTLAVSQAPLDQWDFGSNIWTIDDNEYPTLVAYKYLIKDQSDNFDYNQDGVNDIYQSNVVTALTPDSEDGTFVVPAGGCITDDARFEMPLYYADDPGYTLQSPSMWSVVMYCSSGAVVPVTVIFDKEYDVSKTVLRYLNLQTLTYSNVPGVVFSTITVGGVVKTTATYTVTDGGSLDDDGVANGIIHDPVGLSVAVAGTTTTSTTSSGASVSAPKTGLNKQSLIPYCFMLVGGVLLMGVARPRQLHDRCKV